MNKQDRIRQIWRECFPDDSEEWTDMYFRQTYSDDCALSFEVAGETVSSLLLQPYTMMFHGHTVAVSYISGAATRRKARGHGYMRELMAHALQQSYSRGDMLCTLIPAENWLTDYYRRFGFSTVFYHKVEHYTAIHAFRHLPEYHTDDTTDTLILYEAFCRLISKRDCYINQSYNQFATIMEDNRLSNGIFRAVSDIDGTIIGMAWAVPQPKSDAYRIVDLLYDSQMSHNSILHAIQQVIGSHSLIVCEHPGVDNYNKLTAHGMARIVNVMQTLSILASAPSKPRITIRINDPIITQNCGTFRLADGIVTTTSECFPDLDLNIDVLTSIIFSTPRIGNIIGLPTVRPAMTLMLD